MDKRAQQQHKVCTSKRVYLCSQVGLAACLLGWFVLISGVINQRFLLTSFVIRVLCAENSFDHLIEFCDAHSDCSY